MKDLTKDLSNGLMRHVDNVNGGIVIPAAMYLMGVPLALIVVLWLLFFRG